jgi:hypothetical protein
MRKNRIINFLLLSCLAFMILAAIFIIRTYNDKQKSLAENIRLRKENEILNIQLQKRKNELELMVIEKLKKDAPTDTVSIQKFKTDAISFIKENDDSTYKTALKYESLGFQALLQNKFDIALISFTRVENISPSFHMVYEISRLLRSKNGDYSNPSDIKKQIIQKYSWKAPADLLKKLKQQVGGSFSDDFSDDFK